MFLPKIIKHKEQEIIQAKEKVSLSELKSKIKDCKETLNFASAISVPGHINIIAEIKKASPSKGVMCEDFDPVGIAKEFEEGGAKALSVLTEKQFFKGDPAYIKKIKPHVKLPVLRKDFIIDEYQIFESRVLEADAILLICRILAKKQLQDFIQIAQTLRLSCLVEVHTEKELDQVLKTDAKIIGINNRDLHTFKTDLEVTARLVKMIAGEDKIIVSESGIKTNEDIMYLKSLGVHSVLIGETLIKSSDRAEKIRQLLGK